MADDDLRTSVARTAIAVRISGPAMPDHVNAARAAVARAVADIEGTVDRPVLRITSRTGAGCAPLVVVQVNATIDQRMVRSQTAAPAAADAVAQSVDGLRRRLCRLERRLRAEATGQILPLLDGRPPCPGAPVGLVAPPGRAATLIRAKSCTPVIHPLDGAAFIMDLLDYPFHLFLEDSTLSPAVLHRGGPNGYRLIRSIPGPPAAGFTVSSRPARPMRVAEAVDALNADAARRFLFFLDPAGGHGRVLYRRYDSHLALLTHV